MGMVLALILATIMPLAMSIAPIFMMPPVAIVLLYFYFGAIPAGLFSGLCLISVALYSALTLALSGAFSAVWPVIAQGSLALLQSFDWMMAVLLMFVAPGIFMIALAKRKLPFAKGLTIAIGAQLIGIAATMAMLHLRVGGDLIAAGLNWLRDALAELPGAVVGQSLIMMGRYGLFGADTGIDFQRIFLTATEQKQLLDLLFSLLDQSFRLELVSMLLCSGVATGLIGYSIGARRIYNRRDLRPYLSDMQAAASYLRLSAWRLRPDMIIGLPAIAIICRIAYSMGMAGMDAAFRAMLNLTYLAFAVQGLSAIARRMRFSPYGKRRRYALFIFLILLARTLLTVIGIYSALFGSEGLISKRIEQEQNKRGD